MKKPTVIDPKTLADMDESTVIIDCRFSLADAAAGLADFNAGHIPGALHWDMETDLAGTKIGSNGRHPLPTTVDFEALLQRSGVSAGSAIVLYDQNRLAGVARAWWLLEYFSIGPIYLLNGGLQAWVASGRTLSQHTPQPQAGTILLPSPREDLNLEMPELQKHLGDYLLIDSREAERFQGLAEPIDPVAGRLPGALNLPWQSATDMSGLLLSNDQQRARWQAVLEEPEATPLIYCGSGITASVNALSYVLAGLGTPRLYAGSFSEWCAHPENPIDHDR